MLYGPLFAATAFQSERYRKRGACEGDRRNERYETQEIRARNFIINMLHMELTVCSLEPCHINMQQGRVEGAERDYGRLGVGVIVA